MTAIQKNKLTLIYRLRAYAATYNDKHDYAFYAKCANRLERQIKGAVSQIIREGVQQCEK